MLLLLASCTNFGTPMLAGHEDLLDRGDDALPTLPPVTLTVGQTLPVVRYSGPGAPFPLWIYCEPPGLLQCIWTDDRHIALVGRAAGQAEAFYLSEARSDLPGHPGGRRGADAAGPDRAPDVARVRAQLRERQHYLAQYAYYLTPDYAAAAGRATFQREHARWQHVLTLDVDHCSDRAACTAYARGMALAKFAVAVAAPR